MAKAKQRFTDGKAPKGKKKLSSVEIELRDGPRDGRKMVVCDPPPPRIRFAFPEWCNYYRLGDSTIYEYDMKTPWVTVNALDTYT